jgi:signal transduction histidine kinase
VAWYSPDRFRTQGLLIALTSISMAVLTAVLIQDAWQSTRQTLTDEAQQECATAVAELQQQFADRESLLDPSEPTPPVFEALDLSLRGLSSAVLRSYEGMEGGFLVGPDRRPAGHSAGSFIMTESTADSMEAETRLVLDLGMRAESDSAATSAIREDGNDLLVGCAMAVAPLDTTAWVLKRLSGANNPAAQRRRWWLAGLVLSAVLGLAMTISISFRLQHGVEALQAGLSRLEHDFDYRLPPIGGDFGGVAQAVNRMADRRGTLEGTLRRQDRLAALGRVVSGVAHELRNPLNSLRLTLELLDRRVRKGAAAGEEVREAIDEVDRLDQTLDRLLTFGRPNVRNRRVHDLRPLVDRAVRIVGDQARAKHVQLVLQAAPDPLEADVDALAIEQILINLLMNAIDASPEHGAVTIAARVEPEGIRVAVADTGRGIQPGDREQIFNPYFTTKENGTGLGLAISREMATHQDGSLEFESSQDGTTFSLLLPAQRTHA